MRLESAELGEVAMTKPETPQKRAPLVPDARLVALVAAAVPGARILAVEPLGNDSAPAGATSKGAGYGAPLRIDLECGSARRSVVLHTSTANSFGHDRRSDRAADTLLAADTFPSIPGHARAIDVGAFRLDGGYVSLEGTGEFYLLTEFAEGEPYAQSLRRIAGKSSVDASDLLRVDRLAAYLAELHTEKLTLPFARERALRDLFGSGEGIFGIVDGYPEAAAGITRAQLRRIETLCGDWRWRLKGIVRPLARTHGDFHPFNVLFDASDQPVLLDASRGGAGDPADDVTCMALNYPFFALEHADTWSRFSVLWYRFWSRYLELSKDDGVLRVVAPFLAWRALVLASPIWYPKLSPDARTRLLAFAETALSEEVFAPDSVERMFR
jgi:hypothetical protein